MNRTMPPVQLALYLIAARHKTMGLESDKCYAFMIAEMKGRFIGQAMPKQPQVYKFQVRVLQGRQLDHMRISFSVPDGLIHILCDARLNMALNQARPRPLGVNLDPPPIIHLDSCTTPRVEIEHGV